MPHTRATVDKPTGFTVEKKVNVAFLVALACQTAVLVGTGAALLTRMDSRISALEVTDLRLITERDARRKVVDDRFEFMARDRDRLIRVETKTENIEKGIARIENKLDAK